MKKIEIFIIFCTSILLKTIALMILWNLIISDIFAIKNITFQESFIIVFLVLIMVFNIKLKL